MEKVLLLILFFVRLLIRKLKLVAADVANLFFLCALNSEIVNLIYFCHPNTIFT